MTGVEGEGEGKKPAREEGERDRRFPSPLPKLSRASLRPFLPLVRPAMQANWRWEKLTNTEKGKCSIFSFRTVVIPGRYYEIFE